MTNKQAFCEHCDAMQLTQVEPREETFTVRGTPITVDAATRVCTVCHQPVFDMELDDQKLVLAYAQYRVRSGLLSPDEIRAIRQQYSLSQSAIAKLLGWSPATFVRYESGSLQEVAHDNLLRRFRDDSKWVRELMTRSGDKLTDLQKRKLLTTLNTMETANALTSESVVAVLNDIYVELLRACETTPITYQWVLDMVRYRAEQAGVKLGATQR